MGNQNNKEDETKLKKNKTFDHEEVEKCKLSKEEIDTSADRYTIMIDCDGDQITDVGFYKTNYLKDLFYGEKKMVSDMLMNRTGKIVNSALTSIFGKTKRETDK